MRCSRKLESAILLTVVLIGIADAARAATVTVTPDASTYQVGEIITLHVVGDPQGGSARGIWGRLLYSKVLTDRWVAGNQNTHTITGGGAARVGPLDQFSEFNSGYVGHAYAFSDAFNQLFGEVPVSVEQNTTSVIKLKAAAEGTLEFFWEVPGDGLGNPLVYFGATPGNPAATVTIVPEPGTAMPLALGLIGLLLSPRRRRSRYSRTTATSASTLPSSARP